MILIEEGERLFSGLSAYRVEDARAQAQILEGRKSGRGSTRPRKSQAQKKPG